MRYKRSGTDQILAAIAWLEPELNRAAWLLREPDRTFLYATVTMPRKIVRLYEPYAPWKTYPAACARDIIARNNLGMTVQPIEKRNGSLVLVLRLA